MENSQGNNQNQITLFKELIKDVISLIYQHYLLLKKEFSENAARVVKSIVLVIAAAIIGYAGLIFLGILAVHLLSFVIPSWAALLLVTAVYICIPIIMFVCAINLIGKVIKEPKKFVTEFKKTGEETEKWLKNLKK